MHHFEQSGSESKVLFTAKLNGIKCKVSAHNIERGILIIRPVDVETWYYQKVWKSLKWNQFIMTLDPSCTGSNPGQL